MADQPVPVPTPHAPPVAGPYSPAARARAWPVLAGPLGLAAPARRPGAGAIAPPPPPAPRPHSPRRGDCGASPVDVAKTTVFVTDLGGFAEANAVYAKFFGDHRPARSTVQVSALPLGAAVEIEVWALHPAS